MSNEYKSDHIKDNEKRKFQKDAAGNVIVNATEQPTSIRWDDTTTTDIVYVGFAAVGSLDSAAVWRIMAVNTSDKSVKFADGNQEPDNVWDDRAGLSYS